MIKYRDYLHEYKKLEREILWNPAAAKIISFEIFFVKFFLSYSKFVKVQKKNKKAGDMITSIFINN